MTRPSPRARPAETGGITMSAATALALALGAPVEVVGAAGILAGALPGAITLLVVNGGIRGVLRALVNGRPT